jgi:integrase
VVAVPDATADAVLPYASRQVRAMMELQRYSAMRPGEVISMRTTDVDASGRTWWYRPAAHKLEHHGLDRRVPLGPRAREILSPWLRPHEPEAYLFQPREAEEERRAKLRAGRKSKVQPSQINRRRKGPKKGPGEVYSDDTYKNAIHYAVRKANKQRAASGLPPIEPFAPNQIRHLASDRYQHRFDADTARTALGHRSVKTTEVYMSRDYEKAAEAAEAIG